MSKSIITLMYKWLRNECSLKHFCLSSSWHLAYFLNLVIWLWFCMCAIEQTSQPKLDVFQELLSKHPGVFHPSRTPKSLLVHWQLLKQYYLLDDQSGMLSCLHIYTNITLKHFVIYFVLIWANWESAFCTQMHIKLHILTVWMVLFSLYTTLFNSN